MRPVTQRNTLVSDITRELRGMIAHGEWRPDEFLPARLGVGVST
jgi:DNA-binding GntR family transcriptional regulator